MGVRYFRHNLDWPQTRRLLNGRNSRAVWDPDAFILWISARLISILHLP